MEKERKNFMHFTVVNATDLQLKVECKDETINAQKNKISKFATLLESTGSHVGFKASRNTDKQKVILLMRLINGDKTVQSKRLFIEFDSELIGSITVHAENEKMNIETEFHRCEDSDES